MSHLAFCLAFYLTFYLAFYLAFWTQCSRRTPIHFSLVQEWVKREAPNLRCMLVHSLLLCKRAESSRSQKIRFLKQFMQKLMSDEGNFGYLNRSVGHPYQILLKKTSYLKCAYLQSSILRVYNISNLCIYIYILL